MLRSAPIWARSAARRRRGTLTDAVLKTAVGSILSGEIDVVDTPTWSNHMFEPCFELPRPSSFSPSVQKVDVDAILRTELEEFSTNMSNLLGSKHPVLVDVARYFFDKQGKRVRPSLVLLAAKAISPSHEINSKQQRLAEITECIHVASLLHDDVVDSSETRRGVPSANHAFGNKCAVLAGDFLLSRASMHLARLRDVRVVETMSGAIENLVQGEIMQMRATETSTDPGLKEEEFKYYLQKNYCKTGSLLSHSTTFMEFDDVELTDADVIGELGAGFLYLVHNLNHERWVIAVAAARSARMCYEEALRWCQKREVFGKKLVQHQLVRYQLSEMARRIEGVWAQIEQVTYQFASGVPDHAMADDCTLIKVSAAEVFDFCAREASQLFGGASIVREGQGATVERLYREVRTTAIPGGSSAVLMDQLGRKLAKM